MQSFPAGITTPDLQAVATDSLQAADSLQSVVLDQWSVLDLMAQAGGFQWPILAVLVAGLMTLSVAVVRLYMDRRGARSLYMLAIGPMDSGVLTDVLAANDDSLYRRLLAGMVAVWRSAPESSALGHEARAVLDAARAAYGRTQRLLFFLSSTAGGLGLLGTLVGIYALFSAETRDVQTIFAGIAIAIVSTLLGIIVSIVLEALEALTHSWASKYTEAAEEWSAAVRYRLLALPPDAAGE